jgi:hypothetical protein
MEKKNDVKIINFMEPTMFYRHVAMKYGVNESIVLYYLYREIEYAKIKNEDFDGTNYWVFESNDYLKKEFPFWNDIQIIEIIDSLITKKIISIKNDNWFTIIEGVK